MLTDAIASLFIVSQDEALAGRLVAQCRRERLTARRVASIAEAVAAVRSNAADVVAVDLALPDEDGFDVVRRVRQESDVPLVLLADEPRGVDEEVGLALGADDFVSREVPPRLFVARLRALLRRARPAGREAPLRVGPLQLDGLQLRATVGGRDLDLTLAEIRLLETLMRASGGVLSRRRLLEASGSEGATLERTVDVHVANLRRKLARHNVHGVVQTVRGVGYRLALPSAQEAPAASASPRDGFP